MIGNEDDGHGRIGNVLGASFSLLRLLFFADPPTAEMLSHFDRKFGPRASNKSGVSATAPRLFELVDRSNPSNSTGWILVDADQGRGGFFKSRPALADSIAVERYTEPRRAPRVLRNRLTRLFALLQTKRPEDPEVVAWKLHAEEAILSGRSLRPSKAGSYFK